ncbi:hypothetical protein NX059_006488 [Plenodomus lindquistii]|nr:hypothetical protein NX059_006488 [Plenodomus lindquistii]
MTPPFREIGRGCCGTVYTQPSSLHAIKLENGDPARSILNDHLMHHRILHSANAKSLPIHIPASHFIIEPNSPWWNENLANFPSSQQQQPCRAYIQERIPAVPKAVRNLLIETHCPPALRSSAHSSAKNEDCLIRLYTGKRESGRTKRFFSLRNYGLSVDAMEGLFCPSFDIEGVVQSMAQTLAHCFWVAHVDANDVEFVMAPLPLGPSTSANTEDVLAPASFAPRAQGKPSWTIEGVEMGIWMLDFDCVRDMAQDEGGVRQAAVAFWRNDPYFPRPFGAGHTEEDGKWWAVFREAFLKASEGRDGGLAQIWVDVVEQEGERRREAAEKSSAGDWEEL